MGEARPPPRTRADRRGRFAALPRADRHRSERARRMPCLGYERRLLRLVPLKRTRHLAQLGGGEDDEVVVGLSGHVPVQVASLVESHPTPPYKDEKRPLRGALGLMTLALARGPTTGEPSLQRPRDAPARGSGSGLGRPSKAGSAIPPAGCGIALRPSPVERREPCHHHLRPRSRLCRR